VISMPPCVTSPPKTRASPAAGVTITASPSGFEPSAEADDEAGPQNPVPPPANALGDLCGNQISGAPRHRRDVDWLIFTQSATSAGPAR
jgi:hypothetical protein